MLFALPGLGSSSFPLLRQKEGGSYPSREIRYQPSAAQVLSRAEVVLSLHALIHDSSDSSFWKCQELQPSYGWFLLGARALLTGHNMTAVTFPYDVSLW